MKIRILSLLLAFIMLALGACTTLPETSLPAESGDELTAAEHCYLVSSHFSNSRHLFFNGFSDQRVYDIEIEHENDKLTGTLKASLIENEYEFDYGIDYFYLTDEAKSIDGYVVCTDGYSFSNFDGISSLPLKKEIDTEGIETYALRALYGIRRLASSVFDYGCEDYYRIVETDDKEATIAVFSLTDGDIKGYDDKSNYSEKYGFDKEGLELNLTGSLKTVADGENAVKVTEFQIESSLSFTANGRFCVFTLNHDDKSFDAALKIYSEKGAEEADSEYSLKAENGEGVLYLHGEGREIDTEERNYLPADFKCRTVSIPFKYEQSENPELAGYYVEIENIVYSGNTLAIESDSDSVYSFIESVDLHINFNRFTNSSGYRISGFRDNTLFEIDVSSGKIEIEAPEEYTEDEYRYYLEIKEKAGDFCSKFDILSHAEDIEAIQVKTEDAYYFIDPWNMNGYFETDFTMEEGGIRFTDGRVLPFSYEELVYDEMEEAYTAVINGRNYVLTTSTGNDGTVSQLLECTDIIEGFGTTASVLYYPELEYGRIVMGFKFEQDGDEYTLTYLDGYAEKRVLVYDTEKDEYTFSE